MRFVFKLPRALTYLKDFALKGKGLSQSPSECSECSGHAVGSCCKRGSLKLPLWGAEKRWLALRNTSRSMPLLQRVSILLETG